MKKEQCNSYTHRRINKKTIQVLRCIYEKTHNNIHYNDYTIWPKGNKIEDIF